jgi:hypothetical protein
MPEKKRIRNLSTRWLLPFKVVVFTVYTGLCLAILVMYLRRARNAADVILGLAQAGLYGFIFYRLMKMTSKLYRIEFDDEFLYVLQKDQDIIVPLENIESVEISTMGGVYKVNLFHAEQLGDHFYFKMSLLYPLNYRSKDALVNVLRKNIDLAKRKKQEIPRNALQS